MSRATIEQSLTGLIPALNGPLPPELIDLALSLLTRSRSVAHSLKPDEEIARPYACAQLACERLKQRLNLPTITSRPPCPPRIYKKLYDYLSSALPAATTGTREPQTPSKKATSASASARTTPKTPASGRKTPLSTHRREDANAAGNVPDWVMPGIRGLLKKVEYPAAAPNVFAGVESVLPLLVRMAAVETPSKRARRTTSTAPRGAVSNVRTLALIAVVFLYVVTKMKDVNVTPEQYNSWRDTAVEALLELPVGKEVSSDELLLEIEEMLPLAQSEGWLQMEWFTNVVPLGEGEAMEGVEATGRPAGASRRQGVVGQGGGSEYIGLGTMMQDATDYLGVRQREDYKKWKTGIMARIEQIEAA